MSSHYAKPENALRKAKDLVSAGKESSALRTLHAILTSKRYRTWQPTHEKIIMRYLELATDLRRNTKDAFMQYRTICQQNAIPSLEKVIRKFTMMVEARTKKAEADSAAQSAGAGAGAAGGEIKSPTSASPSASPSAATTPSPAPVSPDSGLAVVLLDTTDVELDDTPESIMLQAVSGEDNKDRAGRAILLPWVKYLWDSYRSILEVLRNNARLETLYHATVRRAFEFCRHHKRNMEFRHLCDILRQHILAIQKHQHQPHSVDLNAGETQRLYLETRFEQLKVASELELWQEAYHAIEDIHENQRQSTVTPKPALMKTYYEKLTAIFWASENYLFHAYSISRFYTLAIQVRADDPQEKERKEKIAEEKKAESKKKDDDPSEEERRVPEAKELSAEEKTRIASACVLATLVIPPSDRYGESDPLYSSENEGNLRLASLLGFKKETPTRARLLEGVSANIMADASPAARGAHRLLELSFGPLSLRKELMPLLAEFEKDELLKKYVPALKNLAVLRLLRQLSTVFKTMKLDQFVALTPDVPMLALERLIMSAVRADQLQLRLDHRAQLLHFSDEGMESARIKDQLHTLAMRLKKVVERIAPPRPEEKAVERKHVFSLVRAGLDAEHKDVFVRKQEIENRKRESERLAEEKERRDTETKAREARERALEEARLLREQQHKRELDRVKREKEQFDMQVKQKIADELKIKLTGAYGGSKSVKTAQSLFENLENARKEQLLKAAQDLAENERKEAEKKKRERARTHDYLVRAVRLEEKDLLVKAREDQMKSEAEAIEADFAKYQEQQREMHARALVEKERFLRMKKHKDIFYEKVMERRRAELAREQEERKRAEKKKADDRAREEKRQRADEEKRRIIEDEKLRQEAEIERKRQEAEAKQREAREKLAEQAAKQRARLEEIEAKQQAERAAAGVPTRAPGQSLTRFNRPLASQPVSGGSSSAVTPAAAAASTPAAGGAGAQEPSRDVWRRGGADSAPAAATPTSGSRFPVRAPLGAGPPAGGEDRQWRREGSSGGSSSASASASASSSTPARAPAAADGARDWRPSSAAPTDDSSSRSARTPIGGSDRFARAPSSSGPSDDRFSRAPSSSGGAPSDRFSRAPSSGGAGRSFGGSRDAPDSGRADREWGRRGDAPAAGAGAGAGASAAASAATPAPADDGFTPAGGPRRGLRAPPVRR